MNEPSPASNLEQQLREMNEALLLSSIRQHELAEQARTAEERLSQSEEIFRRAIEEAPIPVIVHAEDGEVLQISRSWTELTGYTLADKAFIRSWLLQAYGIAGEVMRDVIQQSFVPPEPGKEPTAPVVLKILTRDGQPRTWSFSASIPGTLRDGRRFIVGMAEDITQRQRDEEHVQFLLSELNHRVKNTLSTVQAIAAETRSRAQSLDQFHEAFEGRLQTLATTHNLLVKGSWKPASLQALCLELFRTMMRDQSRCKLGGEDVALSPSQALTVSMMLYELMTNALKYGAWSNEKGAVSVESRSVEKSHGTRVRVEWVESGGPRVAPPTRRGYGTHMLEGLASYELDGETDIEFNPSGLRCTIEFPLSPVATDLA